MQQAKNVLFILTLCFFWFCRTEFVLAEGIPLVTDIQLISDDNTSRKLYYYNNQGQKTLETTYIFIDGHWIRYEQQEWIYAGNVCTEQYFRHWKNNSWTPYYLIESKYNGVDKISEFHSKFQDGVKSNFQKLEWKYSNGLLNEECLFEKELGDWTLIKKKVYIYNESGKNTRIIISDISQNILVERTRFDITYNEKSLTDSILFLEKIDDEWVNQSMTLYFYSQTSLLKTTEISKCWNSMYGGSWTNSQLIEYMYDDAGRLIMEDFSYWDQSFWTNNLRQEYSYTENGSLAKKLVSLPIHNLYKPAWSVVYSNFKHEKPSVIEAKNEFWGGELNSAFRAYLVYKFNDDTNVNLASTIHINYSPIDTITTLNTFFNINEIHVYPNPSKGIFYYDIAKYDIKNWMIADLNGKILYQKQTTERTGVIDLGDLPSGIYIFRASTSEGVLTHKLIRE